MDQSLVILCPGQGAQAVGMGKAWAEASPAAAAVFREADEVLGGGLGRPLSELCFAGPPDRLNRTDVSQPAILACSIACWRGLLERGERRPITATAGLSLGEYTALCLAGAIDFASALRLVARRGQLMQAAAEASDGGMVALIGADEAQADQVCRRATGGPENLVLVPANYNAPGQIVLSGHAEACERAVAGAGEHGLRASRLTVAGAFHSPLMQPAADRMGEALADAPFRRPRTAVWSNVTAEPHDAHDLELLRQRLVEQIVRPVRWAQCCRGLPDGDTISVVELAPGSVLRGLMRRIDRSRKVTSHDMPSESPIESKSPGD